MLQYLLYIFFTIFIVINPPGESNMYKVQLHVIVFKPSLYVSVLYMLCTRWFRFREQPNIQTHRNPEFDVCIRCIYNDTPCNSCRFKYDFFVLTVISAISGSSLDRNVNNSKNLK